jgi:ABC-type multidrug transport system ATPase subunit
VTAPLLRCSDARIDAHGSVLLDALTFEADGARVGLLGAFGPLFRLLAREAELSRGEITVLGCPASSAASTNTVGLASFDPVLPEPWTVLEYLSASAGLLGLSRRAATVSAREALDIVGAGGLAKRPIGTLSGVERRVVLIVHAVIGQPPSLFVERPLSGLSDEDAGIVQQALERATHGRRLIVSVESPAGVGPELNLLSLMDRVVVMQGSTVVAVGPPAEALRPSPRCVVFTTKHAPALAKLLVERGLRVERTDDENAEAGRLVVHLPEGVTTMTIVEAALEAEAPLLELVSVGLDPPG